MEEIDNICVDKLFLVVYRDDRDYIRPKLLFYKNKDGAILTFFNEQTDKIEIINESQIIRMEEKHINEVIETN